MSFPVPAPALRALFLLEDAGYEAYLVGGCVRDMLRGERPHDFDMATIAHPTEILSVFRDFRTLGTGIRHGTVTVLLDGMPLEITTYRTDGAYTDHRRPDSVSFSRSIVEDLARRDFTVNAMAYHPIRGLCDPYGGENDLADGIIRAVGDPQARFLEDALRILRALRFSARFGFSLEENTAMAARSSAKTLSVIAKERIREELFGLLTAEHAEKILSEYADILYTVLPEGRLTESFSRVPAELPLRAAEYLSESGADRAAAALSRLKTDNKTLFRVQTLIRLLKADISPRRADLCRLLRAHGERTLCDALLLRDARGLDGRAVSEEIDRILAEKLPYTLRDLAITGDEVVAKGLFRGPDVGKMLEELYTEVIEGRLENKADALLAYIEKSRICV